MIYKNILLAVDFYVPVDRLIIERGIEFAKECQAKLTLLHIIEHPYAVEAEPLYPIMIKSPHEMTEEAKKKLAHCVAPYKLSQENLMVEVGVPKTTILETAKKINADLIILGSHSRHGLNLLLLGSTANAVLHQAPCDVLAIRAKE